ncbi:MAG TPA: T9SS type A sorting domain-containing protein [Flavilitoribacter sp.]|nr:T9SS type A sorting domain-containing protein [Flavilitoribacter sp.]
MTEHRTVILGIHELGLYGKDADMTEYATEDFYRLMLRSVEWILGAGDDAPLVGTKEPVISRNISAYPNPATGQVTLSFDLQGLEQGSLSLTNMMGQRFDIFRNRQLFQGNNQVDVDLSGFAAGMYMYQLEANGKIFVGKLVITK